VSQEILDRVKARFAAAIAAEGAGGTVSELPEGWVLADSGAHVVRMRDGASLAASRLPVFNRQQIKAFEFREGPQWTEAQIAAIRAKDTRPRVPTCAALTAGGCDHDFSKMQAPCKRCGLSAYDRMPWLTEGAVGSSEPPPDPWKGVTGAPGPQSSREIELATGQPVNLWPVMPTSNAVMIGTPSLALEECVKVSKPGWVDEIPVTEEMIKAVGNLAAISLSQYCLSPDRLTAIYRAMAALAPKLRYTPEEQRFIDKLPTVGETIQSRDARIAALEAENERLVIERDTAFRLQRLIQRLGRSNAELKQAREADVWNMTHLNQSNDHWIGQLAAKDSRIAELKSELAAMRIAPTQPTQAQTGQGDLSKPTNEPKPMPAAAIASSKSDPRRIGG
jgi:hypothetical protein